jgi:dTDP-4-dehydrorhamnose reductase
MDILITGSHGQLGSELKKVLWESVSELGTLPLFYAGCRATALDIDV